QSTPDPRRTSPQPLETSTKMIVPFELLLCRLNSGMLAEMESTRSLCIILCGHSSGRVCHANPDKASALPILGDSTEDQFEAEVCELPGVVSGGGRPDQFIRRNLIRRSPTVTVFSPQPWTSCCRRRRNFCTGGLRSSQSIC